MIRFTKAAVTGLIAAVIALAIVWAITLIRGASFVEAIRQPTFWLVEGAAMVVAMFLVLSESRGTAATTRSPMRRVSQRRSPGPQAPPRRSDRYSQSQPTPQSGNSRARYQVSRTRRYRTRRSRPRGMA
jgi:hypothetical protein